MRVNPERLREDLERLGEFGRDSSGGVSRPAFSSADIAARRWFADRAEIAGLHVRTDTLLNVIVDLNSDDGPAVWTGSHLDSVPNGGMFDGTVGAIAGLECLRRIHEERVSLAWPVRTVAFQDEEGAFRSYLGSTALVRGVTTEEIRTISNRDGQRLNDALVQAHGVALVDGAGKSLEARAVRSFVELHVEQGPVLEANNTSIGVVTSIVGVNRAQVRFDGRSDHAGTTPMDSRRDALRGAAAFLDRLPELPARCGNPEAVVTCGRIALDPGLDNVVPCTAIVHLDFRAGTKEGVDRLEHAILREARACGFRHGLEVEYQKVSMTPPVQTNGAIRNAITRAAKSLGLSTRELPSGAGHDTQVMSALAPVGMIFVPSREGRSHSPLEFTSWEQIENGANVLLETLLRLAGRDEAVA